MLKKIFILFKLGRKLARSDILTILSKFKKPPLAIKILFQILSFSFSPPNKNNLNENEGAKLSKSLQSMGTTFIKLGQFLVTRPDIIGDDLAKQLEGLQDRLPAFTLTEAKAIIKKDLGDDTFNSIIDLSEPVAAASIAQVHKAKINDNGTIKDVAIKILRPNIKKVFNEEIDALMLFAFMVESFIKKTKRLKLVEVVFLLKEITNLEMDLRFEAAAANEYAENTKNDAGFRVPTIYWNFTSENVMTLDWVEGVSIRETEDLQKRNIDTKRIASDVIQHFLRHAVRDGFFHADMHQGNIFIDDNGQIVPIDFGIMGRLDNLSKRFLAEILFGFIQRDYKKVAEVHLVAGLVPNPNTNIWETSKPVLESWLRETKDPINTLNESLKSTTEVIKRLPDFPEIMDKANQALSFLASGQIPQNSNSFTALNEKRSEMTAFRNQSIVGLLLLVIFGLVVF
jgi:ubiquinone biosynthesis protein